MFKELARAIEVADQLAGGLMAVVVGSDPPATRSYFHKNWALVWELWNIMLQKSNYKVHCNARVISSKNRHGMSKK